MTKTIEIPEGYAARIEGNKVILEPKESEDERIKKDIITTLSIGVACNESALHPGAYTTLKEAIAYLERQKEQRPAEWSEEDKMHLNNAILAAEKEWGAESCTAKFLKSLRPQPRWKPSKEQMWALDVALENFYDQNDRAALNSLKIDLQKLL